MKVVKTRYLVLNAINQCLASHTRTYAGSMKYVYFTKILKKKQITLILLSTALIYRFCQRLDYKVSYMVNIMQRVIVG